MAATCSVRKHRPGCSRLCMKTSGSRAASSIGKKRRQFSKPGSPAGNSTAALSSYETVPKYLVSHWGMGNSYGLRCAGLHRRRERRRGRSWHRFSERLLVTQNHDVDAPVARPTGLGIIRRQGRGIGVSGDRETLAGNLEAARQQIENRDGARRRKLPIAAKPGGMDRNGVGMSFEAHRIRQLAHGDGYLFQAGIRGRSESILARGKERDRKSTRL